MKKTGSAFEGYTFHIGDLAHNPKLPSTSSVLRNTGSLQIGQTNSMQLSCPSVIRRMWKTVSMIERLQSVICERNWIQDRFY